MVWIGGDVGYLVFIEIESDLHETGCNIIEHVFDAGWSYAG